MYFCKFNTPVDLESTYYLELFDVDYLNGLFVMIELKDISFLVEMSKDGGRRECDDLLVVIGSIDFAIYLYHLFW